MYRTTVRCVNCVVNGTEIALLENGVDVDPNSRLGVGSEWVLRSAEEIDDYGDIVGYGTPGRQTRAFLLSPVPEPMPIALMLADRVLLAWRQARFQT